jgi:hypothetical protein
MCFAVNKDYAGELTIRMINGSIVNGLVTTPAEHADLVAVQDSGVRNVTNIGHGSAVVETAMTPQALGDTMSNAKSNLVQIVSKCVDTVLIKHKVKSEEKRMEISMDVCDEIIRFLDNPKNYKKKDAK